MILHCISLNIKLYKNLHYLKLYDNPQYIRLHWSLHYIKLSAISGTRQCHDILFRNWSCFAALPLPLLSNEEFDEKVSIKTGLWGCTGNFPASKKYFQMVVVKGAKRHRKSWKDCKRVVGLILRKLWSQPFFLAKLKKKLHLAMVLSPVVDY